MPPTIQHLIDQWLTEASTLRAQAHTLRADCMYETARRLRIQADQLADCATQLTSVAQLNQPASITPANQEAAQAAMAQVRSKEQELLRPLRQRAEATHPANITPATEGAMTLCQEQEASQPCPAATPPESEAKTLKAKASLESFHAVLEQLQHEHAEGCPSVGLVGWGDGSPVSFSSAAKGLGPPPPEVARLLEALEEPTLHPSCSTGGSAAGGKPGPPPMSSSSSPDSAAAP